MNERYAAGTPPSCAPIARTSASSASLCCRGTAMSEHHCAAASPWNSSGWNRHHASPPSRSQLARIAATLPALSKPGRRLGRCAHSRQYSRRSASSSCTVVWVRWCRPARCLRAGRCAHGRGETPVVRTPPRRDSPPVGMPTCLRHAHGGLDTRQAHRGHGQVFS